VRVGATFDEILKQFPKEVRLVFKMHPLPMHQSAMIAAQGALAAQKQGKFLEMHKKLYESMSSLSRDKVFEVAKGLGLDMDRFGKDVESPEIKAQIEKEAKEAMDIGATGTPAAFVNGRYVSGAKPAAFFADMINEELKWAREKSRPTFTVGKHVRETMPPQAQKPQGPDPNKVYDIPAGNAPFVGSANAKVTILHYLDYQ